MSLTIVRAGSDRVRFSDGVRATTATRPQLLTVLRRLESYVKWKVDGVPVDESDVRALLSALDEARELNR